MLVAGLRRLLIKVLKDGANYWYKFYPNLLGGNSNWGWPILGLGFLYVGYDDNEFTLWLILMGL